MTPTMQRWRLRPIGKGVMPFLCGLAAGFGITWACLELPYRNWVPVVPPLAEEPLTIRHDAKGDGRFGAPRSGNRVHRGVDLVAALGSPVFAIQSGTVIEAGTHRGLGQFVWLEHRRGLRSLYGHLASVAVKPGERVKQGALIGTVGKTGNARSRRIVPHLHLEVEQDGRLIDPTTLGLSMVEAQSLRQHIASSP